MSAVNSETVVFDQPAEVQTPAGAPDAGTALPKTEVTATEESQETQKPETPKTFTQEEVDRIAQKERERAERRATRKVGDELQQLRELVQKSQQPQQEAKEATQGEPTRDQFESYEDYIRALGRYEARQELTKAEQVAKQREQKQSVERYQREFAKVAEQRIDAGRKEFADFDEVINDAAEAGVIPIGSALHTAIIESDIGHKVAYHLAKHPDEAERLAGLSPLSMAREVGKLEVKLSAAPAAKPKPAPIEPVGGSNRATGGLRDDDDMDSWVKRRNAELRKR